MPIETFGSSGHMLFQLHGQFGPAEAKVVEEVLAHAGRGAQFTIDFTRVREFEDLAIGALAASVMKCAATVALRGLAQHQRRMLRYLGVDADAPAAVPAAVHAT